MIDQMYWCDDLCQVTDCYASVPTVPFHQLRTCPSAYCLVVVSLITAEFIQHLIHVVSVACNSIVGLVTSNQATGIFCCGLLEQVAPV